MEEQRHDNPQADYEIRPTDNGMKWGDVISPQTAEPLELDANGLPVGFDTWEVFKHGNR